MSRKRSGCQNKLFLIISLLVLLLGGALLAGDFAVLWAEKHVRAFNSQVKQAAAALDAVDQSPTAAVSRAQQHLTIAHAELDAMRPVVDPLARLAGQATGLPWVGRPAQELANLWSFANEATNAGQTLLNVARFGLTSLEKESVAGLVEALPELQKHLHAAENSFVRTQAARSRLHSVAWLPDELEADLDAFLARWDAEALRVDEAISNANRLVWIISALLDNDRPMTYLLIVQSSDNLRATGGFLTGVGTVRIEQGKITEVTIVEVTEVEDRRRWTKQDWEAGISGAGVIPPPEPVTRYLGLGHWIMRDANWWADFPTTARQVAGFWQMVKQEPLDGVIAINDQGVEALLRAVGPVEIESGEVVSADNLQGMSVARIYHGDNSGQDQSMYFQELAFTLTALSENVSPERLLQLSAYLQRETVRHNLMITSFDPEINAILHLLGIDGALQGQQDDYLYVVEDDLSDTKLNPFIQRDLSLEVLLGPGGKPLLSTLTVNETNTYRPGIDGAKYPEGYYDGSRWNPITRQMDTWPGYYGGYLRLFLPAGSHFVEAAGLDEGPDVGAESGRAVIGGYFGLHPGDQRQMQFKWIPAGAPGVPHHYRLVMQHQPGALPRRMTVTVRLLTDYQVAEAIPSPTTITEDTITWQTTFDQDLTLSLMFEGDGQTLTHVPPAVKELAASVFSSAPPTPAPAATPRVVAQAPPAPPGRAPVPVWLSIPSIEINAPIVPVGLEPSGIMASPSEADIVGWYEFGPRPGEVSNAILAGHVDWMGEVGSFARLHELQPGDVIEVQSGPQAGYRYVVESLEAYQADAAPVAEIFGPTEEPVLTLITCGGPYDSVRQAYRDRLVVRARGQ